ncbi:ATP-binding cassette domain-containing protein [Streptomyces sp. SID3343]|uniref:branched-chain amino acid ABC transporter ATP-binding protein/permease n=1 Tax=Streptomyces sp. SID3343 TaxID=2690260 RepID=UPI00136EBC1A|nr:ATP-binding cassette domain-containing protein [Streptomyces sp. SID3343]MYW06381.1 ATP-binding cassette domain-containing protein [Streptomyces sp. SID3343]
MNLLDKRSAGLGLVLAILACVAIPNILSPYWLYLAITSVISAVIMQSYGVIVGRAGVMSLCQLSFAAIGAWVVMRLNLADAPGGLLLWLVLGGLAAAPVGVLIGLPALRVRGVNLAVITFGAAVSTDIVLNARQFPGTEELKTVARPAQFASNANYFVLVVIVFTVIAFGLLLLDKTRLGMSWLELRHSERIAASHGISVARSKLAAFAISAFIAGVGGGLMAGQLGLVVSGNFAMGQSVTLFAIAILIGPHHPEGALMSGVFGATMATILEKIKLPQDLGGIIFGIVPIFALRSGMSQTDFTRNRKRLAKARTLVDAADAGAEERIDASKPAERVVGAPARPLGTGPALVVTGLTVRYGPVVALDAVDLTVPAGTVVGLIGPNGAGKSTFISAVGGFLGKTEGTVHLDGARLDGLAPQVRAARGLRRTFQTSLIAPELTQYQYLDIGAGRRLDRAEADELLEFFGCPVGDLPISIIDAGTRRLLDVAAAIAARPAVALLDEPAAGQSAAESLRLGARLAEVPERYGVSILLVEHDMELVRVACREVTVLDFGHVIASGPTEEVLHDPAVMDAYLGTSDTSESADTVDTAPAVSAPTG